MKAIVINRYGNTEVLEYQDLEKPTIKADQLLIQVYASSINPVDWKLRQGQVQLLSGFNFPRVLGSDLSGVVVEVGSQVTKFRPGDEVYTFLNPLMGGAYAEFVAVCETDVARKPQNLTHLQAAAIPLAGLTALQALRNLGEIEAGQRILINGASGGVGTLALQIAKAFNTEVTGVCSGKNLELIKSLGADMTLDYMQTDFTQQPILYDIIFDAVGVKSFSECESILQPNGIYISTLPSFDNVLPVVTSWLFPGKKAKLILSQPRVKDLDSLRDLIESQKIRPVIDRTYPLAEIAKAQLYSETGRVVGKVVIEITT